MSSILVVSTRPALLRVRFLEGRVAFEFMRECRGSAGGTVPHAVSACARSPADR
jgi:hypothetical protein